MRDPQRIAIEEPSGDVSWSSLETLVRRMTSAALACGVESGDTFAAASRVPSAFLAACIAAGRCGCAFVPLPTRLNAEAMRRLIDHCAPSFLLSDDGESATLGTWPMLKGRISTAALADDSANVDDRALQAIEIDPEHTYVVLYTSGTTSAPRGVDRSARVCATWWQFLADHNALSPETVNLVTTPLYSGMTIGSVLPTLVAGGRCIFVDDFAAEHFLHAVRRLKPTFSSMSPTHWAQLVGSSRFDPEAFSSYRRMISGGARLDPKLKAELISTFPRTFVEMYGTSESGAIADMSGADPMTKLGSVGRALNDTEIRVLDRNDAPCESGVEGEVAVRTSRLMTGYYRDAEATARAWWRDPANGTVFYRTGDIGRVDNDGYLWLSGRRDDVIITAGFNIHPSDIEAVLLQNSAVSEAAVIGRADAVLGETPLAFVVLKAGYDVDAGHLCRWANQRLSKNQRLFGVRLVREIPKTPAGKPLKRALRSAE
jgi:acyl-CoA synthetase (AMP-forming)/AMP-acid ligase II